MLPDDPRHGTRRGYYAHRKEAETACAPCKRAAAAAEARYAMLRANGKQSRLSPHGVQRRIRALSALGYTWERLDDELGEVSRMSEKWARGNVQYVFPRTYAKVAEVYERLSMTLPPQTTPHEKGAVTRSRNRARREGWAPPLAWDDIDDPNERPQGDARCETEHNDTVDEVIVQRVIDGQPRTRKLTRAESAEAVRRLRRAGVSGNVIEARYGLKAERYKEAS